MVEFKAEKYGADVATIHESDEQVVEVMRRKDGLFDLIVHNRKEGTDDWDDLTATLRPVDFIELGRVADAYLCQEADCPSFGQRPSTGCRCHPKYQRN